MAAETVADAVAHFLERIGIDTAFGVASVHNVPLLDAIGRREKIRFVASRGEMGGGHMADGYSRVSGRPAVLLTSTGPGAANAVPALLEARTAGTPLIHVTGATATRFAGRGSGSVHDVPAQSQMLESVCKSAYRIKAADEAVAILTRAATEMLTAPMGPVSLEIPIDIQRARLAQPQDLDALVVPVSPPAPPAEADLDELARRVISARRPMLWTGSGAREAGDAVKAVLELGFGLVTSWAGRGVVGEDHPCSLGAMNGSGLQSIEDFYASVDLMLIVGSRVRGHETADFTVRLPARRIQVDIDPAANNRTYESEFFVCGDARATLDGLARRLRGKLQLDKAFAGQLQALKRQAREEYRRSLGPYASFADRLRSVLPRDAIWARDITIAHSTWGTRLFEVYGPRDSVYPMSAGIGEGLSLGIGAALAAAPRKTVILTGDGGLAFNLGELWTAVQEKAPAVIIVMNDGGYGVIRHIQDATAEGRRRYCDLLGPNLQDLAGLAGLSFWRVKEQETLVQSVAAALDTQGPAMVEVDMRAIGEAPRYYPYGPKIPNSAR